MWYFGGQAGEYSLSIPSNRRREHEMAEFKFHVLCGMLKLRGLGRYDQYNCARLPAEVYTQPP